MGPRQVELAVLQLECPRPPSINRLWRVGQGRMFRSKEYMAWIKQFGLYALVHMPSVRAEHPIPITKDFALNVTISSTRADLDNVSTKALLDALQSTGIIGNDRQCVAIQAQYGVAPEGCKVTLTY